MDFKKLILPFLTLLAWGAQSQVKIGQNPNSINTTSILELESTNKALVLTRLTSVQMTAITPLNGALIYNTDTHCIHYFNGAQWNNLCNSTNNVFSFTDNGNGTITLDDAAGNSITYNIEPETVTTLSDNGDGTFTYINELGTETIITNMNQLLETDTTPGNIGLVDGNQITINVNDADSDVSNEIQDLQFTGELLSLTADPDATTVDLSIYDNTLAIAAVQADVDLNESDADAAIALKENSTNKSSDVTLADTTNTLFPTELAVKTYVDNQIGTIITDDDISAVDFDGTNLNVTESGTTLSADISSLDDTAAIAAVQADIDLNEADADAAIAAVQADVDANESNTDAVIALKENSTNKSSDVTLADATNTLFPTELAVKTYVDNAAQHTGTAGSVYFAGATGNPTDNNPQLFWDTTNNRLGIGTNTPTHKVQVNGEIRASSFANADGTANAPSYRFTDDLNTGMFRAAADQLGFSTAGSEAIRIDASGNIGIGTATPDEALQIAGNMRLDGSLEDKDGDAGTFGQVLSTTATGTDWVDISAVYESPIKAFGKISAGGAVTRATTEVTSSRLSVGRYVINLPPGAVSDADYIIQLTQPGRAGAGNDDPGISYTNQTATSFEVIIGDNDNGGTDRSRFDSEFMFTILDL